MLTLPFPQSREVRCEGIIDQVMRILEVSEASLKQIDIPEVEVLRLLHPSLHVQAEGIKFFSTLDIPPNSLNIMGNIILLSLSFISTLYSSQHP